MTDRAERLLERAGDKLDEWFAHNPQGDAYEIVPVVLRAVVEELEGVTLQWQEPPEGGQGYGLGFIDGYNRALATLLEAAGDE